MVTPTYGFVLLLAAGGRPALSGSSLRHGASYNTRVLASLPEVHALRDPGPDISGLEDAQRIPDNNVGKDKGSLGVPTPAKNLPPLCGQDSRKLAPHSSGGRGVPAH